MTTTTPIADYALLSDRHSAALVARDGSVDWLCLPRFDSPSVFGALLDDRAGRWSIRPAGACEVSRRYVDATMVLETTFETGSGTLLLTDALVAGDDRDVHRLGAGAPHVLARSAACVRGSVDVEVRYAPRPEYGLVVPLLCAVPGGMRARGGPDRLTLSSPVELSVVGQEAAATVPMREGARLLFALHWAGADAEPPAVWGQGRIAAAIDTTTEAWRRWSDAHQRYDGPYRDLVSASGRVLQALSYQPTGAIVAAATTSLPETPGGERNWDYRYSWIRDASFTMDALWVAACPDEAGEFLTFMTTAAASYEPERALQIVFGVGCEHDLSERELPHLRGWRGSRPVRVGNGAWLQTQIDVYGELLAAVHRLADQIGPLDRENRAFLVALADAAAAQWREPDHGIWEIRGEPRHYLYSKLMCWVAVDRALALGPDLDAGDHAGPWREAREEIRAAILREGWDESAGAYTQAFGSSVLDASALMMPIVGFLPPDDPRMLATVAAIAERLVDEDGLVYRYRAADGLPGEEGPFLMCTFWLAQAQALAGWLPEARATFARAAAFANDVGLLAEEVCPRTRELLGNFPQAFSHIGLVNAAWAIAQAEGAASDPACPSDPPGVDH
ncbi:glycoside hydrolase family 15 protein [Sphaerisporangium album]|uniref:Glycoside hydrolase family 15 protein n=1 Tax=Sphaerisporangium album TaxID=509200 RepID=A0A367EXD2_9ACTN|nr:glycoside hydrolase family 15 protein [Sphaerisporangium album]RCG22784.1 glycoside hydrolase family 15 protein [Sphaerisporangium album]